MKFNHDTIHSFLNNRLDPHKWQHELREKFRIAWWKKIVIDRAQHFAGIDRGINRQLSTAYVKSLESEADDIQFKLDHGIIPSVDPDSDPRPKLKVLRMILNAGIQTPERDHRHRKRQGTAQCTCGNGVPTVHHISWECSCFCDIRADIWQHLPWRLHELPMCFQCKFGSVISKIGMTRLTLILHQDNFKIQTLMPIQHLPVALQKPTSLSLRQLRKAIF